MPQRGEVWMVDLGLVQKVRPALILNVPFQDTDRALLTVIPTTTTLRGSQYEIKYSTRFLKPGAFLVQNPLTIPAVKAIRLLGKVDATQLTSVENGVRAWLGL